jgi:hypothetical protein
MKCNIQSTDFLPSSLPPSLSFFFCTCCSWHYNGIYVNRHLYAKNLDDLIDFCGLGALGICSVTYP